MTIRSAMLHFAVIVLVLSDLAIGQQIASPPASNSGAIASGEKFPWPSSINSSGTSQSSVAAVKGSLGIRAIQGTQGGPPIGSVPVEIELRHRGMLLDTIKAQLDEHGVLVLEDVPVAMGVQPIARVQYADLTYQVAGGLMDATHPTQQLDVACYEPTEEQPAWTIEMRHVMIAEAPEGVHVTEVLVVNNPADRTWIGAMSGVAKGASSATPDAMVRLPTAKRVTTAFALPADSKAVTLGEGFHNWCCSTLANGKLVNHLPLMPGSSKMIYTYVVPAREGRASVEVVAPAAVDHLMVLVPAAQTIESSAGLEQGSTETMGAVSVRTYMASNLAEGQQVRLTLAGLHSAKPVSVGGGAEHVAKIVLAVGGGLVLVLAVSMFALRKAKPVPHATGLV